jgi:hypothetical protein
MAQSSGEGRGSIIVDSVAIFVSLVGVAAAMTLVYLSMRAVMNVGGFCAEGGPYQIATHCPKGTAGFMLGGIWGGLIFAALYVWRTIKARIGSFVGLLWPALFLSLGWNFLDFAIHPPEGQGLVGGWLVCAVLFFIMGGAPLVPALLGIVRWLRGGPPRLPLAMAGLAGAGGALKTAFSTLRQLKGMQRDVLAGTWMLPGSPGGTPAGGIFSMPPVSPGTGTMSSAELVAQLERLDALHRSGALDDAQFEAAKRSLLGTGGGT